MLHDILRFGFAGIALLCLIGAWFSRPRRGPLIWAAISAAFAAVAAHYHVFWVLAIMGMMVPWALVTALQTIDFSWRMQTGFVLFLALGAALAIFPTYHDEKFGRIDDGHLSSEERSALEVKAQQGE